MYWNKKIFTGVGAVILALFGVYGVFVTCIMITGTVQVQIRTILIFILVFCVFMVAWIKMFINMKNEMKRMAELPIHEFETEGKDVLYIDETGDIRRNTLVSLYIRDKIDDRIGYGVVTNVSNKYIAIEVVLVLDEYKEVMAKARCNDKEILKKMYVMPRIYLPEAKYILQIIGGENNASAL